MIFRAVIHCSLAALCSGAIFGSPSFGLLDRRQMNANFGPKVTMGQTVGEYMGLSTIYVAGYPPANPKGSTFLWPGLFDQNKRYGGDLIQTVTELHDPKGNQQTCGAKPGQWCIRPFVVNMDSKQNGAMSSTPSYGKAIDATDRILIEYTKEPGPTGAWTQKMTNLSKGNKVLFSYVKGKTACKWLEIATEYQYGATGTADTQHYYNTTVTLREPEPGLASKYRVSGPVNASKPVSTDGGKTWSIAEITIPPKLPGTQWKPSAQGTAA